MTTYIDSQKCCMTGLMIIAKKAAAFRHDHQKFSEATQEETEHLKTCTVCNSDLLVEGLFKRRVIVREAK